ncbi:MAG: fibronectin type III domain-containing protein, partial [Clostridia bacterium]|nr:fibronectin type III domain-containing protein [Clostridia bacterium]
KNSVTLDYLSSANEFSIYCRLKGESAFILVGKSTEKTFTITNLEENRDYEFYVASGNKTSRIRLARAGESVGLSVINYLHPDDEIIFSCRTAINGANSFHDSNYMTFDRIKI